MPSLTMTASELKCLSFIANHGRVRVSEMREKLKVSSTQMSRILANLYGKGFIRTEKVGLSKLVSSSETKHATLLRKLIIEFSHMRFDKLLSGPSLEVLSAICFLRLKSRKEIAQNSLVSEASVANALDKMKQAGIVQKTGGAHILSSRFQTLKDFVIEFRHYLNQKTALGFAEDAVIAWECNTEFIVESSGSEEEGGFALTGVSVFPRFGIPLMAPKSYLFYSSFARKLRLEDIIVHALLVHEPSMLPILLLWKKHESETNKKYLEEQAEKYGVLNSVNENHHILCRRGP